MEPYEDKETAEVKSETEKHPIKYVVNWQNYGDNVIGYLFPIDEEPFTTIGIEEEQNSDCSSIKIQTEPNQELNEIEQNDNLPDTQERPFHCDECPKNFKHKTSLNRHKRIHSGEMRYQCDECFKKFNHDYRLAQHKLIHTGEMDFVCDKCDMKFRQRCHLTRHRRIHTGERPYHCDQCYMKFVQQSSLIIHKRVHTGELPYECDECPMKFSMKSNLNSHKKLHAKSVI